MTRPELDLSKLTFDRKIYVEIELDALMPSVPHWNAVGEITDILWCGAEDRKHLLKLKVGGCLEAFRFHYIDLEASGIVILDEHRREVLFDSRTDDCKAAGKV